MKKQVVIVTRKLIMGGVERALLGMLKAVDYSAVDIDLYVQELGGELEEELPSDVKLYQLPTYRAKDAFRSPISCIKKVLILKKLRQKESPYEEQCYLSCKMLRPLNKKYDCAIAYHAPNTIPVFYVIDDTDAKKKVLWLHGDMENNSGLTRLLMTYHSQYDQVYAVSKSVRNSFLRVHPNMQNKTNIFYNYVDEKEIWEKAGKAPTFNDNFAGLRILTIGRLTEQKGIDIAIDACSAVVEQGYSVRWYVCGEGENCSELTKRIRDKNIENSFFLLGNQSNPYGYLKDCSLYVQPSRYEGYCTTTNEARIMHKVVITTDVSGAQEQFDDMVTGYIVPINVEKIAERIIWCMEHQKECREIEKRLEEINYSIDDHVNNVFCI